VKRSHVHPLSVTPLFESSNSVNGQVFEFENSYADPLACPAHKCLMTRHKQLR
jgi:hypothetical protein